MTGISPHFWEFYFRLAIQLIEKENPVVMKHDLSSRDLLDADQNTAYVDEPQVMYKMRMENLDDIALRLNMGEHGEKFKDKVNLHRIPQQPTSFEEIFAAYQDFDRALLSAKKYLASSECQDRIFVVKSKLEVIYPNSYPSVPGTVRQKVVKMKSMRAVRKPESWKEKVS
jgi:hypothetical protein